MTKFLKPAGPETGRMHAAAARSVPGPAKAKPGNPGAVQPGHKGVTPTGKSSVNAAKRSSPTDGPGLPNVPAAGGDPQGLPPSANASTTGRNPVREAMKSTPTKAKIDTVSTKNKKPSGNQFGLKKEKYYGR
jgi:hypothetical protein